MKPYIRPEFLKPGDTVAVVAMASSLSEKSRQTMYWKEMLESWGLRVKLGKHLYDSAPGEFAGRDEDRAADIAEMLLDPEVKALISFRGGYGSMRTVRALGTQIFAEHPKWLVGFSDITVFHAVLQSLGIESILGAMPSTLGDDSHVSEESLRKALFGEIRSYRTAPHPFSVCGSARGRLVGGNLSLVHSCLRTPWDNHLDEDSIFFIEDVDERMYNLDRMLLTLQQGGYFERAKGIVVGRAYEMLEYDIPRAALEQAVVLTPGIESPTVAPLSDPDWVAVKALCLRKGINETMDQLERIGARGIVAAPIRAARI